jgi:hypothetical protein
MIIKHWFSGLVACLLLVSVGCGKKGNHGDALSDDGKKLSETTVEVTEVPTTAKTATGKAVRVYDITVPSTKLRSVVVVVGDPAVPVEIPNARFFSVGGKKAELDLASADGAYVVPVTDPACGYRKIAVGLDELVKQAKANGTLDLPAGDL